MLDQQLNEFRSEEPIPGDPSALLRVERELRDSANRLGQGTSHLPAAWLITEFQRRRHARFARQAWVFGLVSVSVVIACLTCGVWFVPFTPQPNVAGLPESTGHANVSTRAGNLADEMPRSTSSAKTRISHSEKPHKNRQQVVGATGERSPSVQPVSRIALPESDSGPIPVLVQVKQEDGQIVLTPGLILPERSVRLDWSQLSPSERLEVRQILDLDSENTLVRPAI